MTDPVVRAASAVLGGPPGRRLADGRGSWRAGPVLVLLACAVLAAGVVQKQHCRAQGWSSPDMFWHACYSDFPIAFAGSNLGADAAARPGLQAAVSGDSAIGQPPLAAAAMWVLSGFVSDEGVPGQRQFFDLSALLLAAALATAVAAVSVTAQRARGTPWDAGHLALSPTLVTAGLISYTLLAVALSALAVRAWHRGRAVPAGVWLGLAVAAAPELAVVVLAVVVVGVRGGPAASRVVAAATVTWVCVRLLLVPGFGAGVLSGIEQWWQQLPGYGSLWLVPQLLGQVVEVGALTAAPASVLSGLLLIGLLVTVLRLTAAAEPRADLDGWPGQPPAPGQAPPERATSARVPREVLPPLALAMLCAVLISAKALPPQAGLLLLPLIALAGLAWRDHLIWATTECVYFVGVWLFIAADSDATKGLPAQVYLVLLLARLAGIGWIGVQAVVRCRVMAQEAGLRPAVQPAPPGRHARPVVEGPVAEGPVAEGPVAEGPETGRVG